MNNNKKNFRSITIDDLASPARVETEQHRRKNHNRTNHRINDTINQSNMKLVKFDSSRRKETFDTDVSEFSIFKNNFHKKIEAPFFDTVNETSNRFTSDISSEFDQSAYRNHHNKHEDYSQNRRGEEK
eukprot:UN28790